MTSTDRCVHREVLDVHEPGRRLHARLEPGRPASGVLDRLEARVALEAGEGGTRVIRCFDAHGAGS